MSRRPGSPDTLAGQLRRGFGLLILLVAVIGAAGVASVQVATHRVEHLSTVLAPAIEANAHALQVMVDAETGVRGYLLTGRPEFLEPYEQARLEVFGELDRAHRLGARAGVSADFTGKRAAARRWLESFAEPAVAGRDDRVVTALTDKRYFDAYRAEQTQVAAALAAEREVVRGDARWFRAWVVPGILLMTLLFVVVAVLVARAGVASVAAPLAGLRAVLERLRSGEHSARATTEGPLEVREVARATNALADESNRLRAEQLAAARLRQSTRDGARELRDELGSDAVLSTAASVLGRLLAADHVLVRHGGDLVGPGRPGRVAAEAQWHRGTGPASQGLLPADSSVLAALRRCAGQGDVLAFDDLDDTGDRPSGELGRPVTAAGTEDAGTAVAVYVRGALPAARAAVVAPITAGDLVTGIVVLAWSTRRRTTGEELLAVQLVVSDLGRALEHSKVYEQQLQLVDRLQQLDRQKTDFLSTISHELRTPLTSIAGYTEMLRDGDAGDLAPAVSSMVEVIKRNADRLGVLIEDLLMLSRIESGHLHSTVAPVDLDRVVAGALQALTPQAAAGRVHLLAAPPSPRAVLTAPGDAAQLERVVLNLMSNAVKFTPPGGRVEVAVERDGSHARLTVQDTGIGIPAAEQHQLSARFFRASNAVSGAVPGTGLGLSIVRGIVDLHGGTMVVHSEEGQGTRVEVRIPLAGTLAGTTAGTAVPARR